MVTDTENTMRIHISEDRRERPVAVPVHKTSGSRRTALEAWTGLGAAFLAGMLGVAAFVASTPFTPTQLGLSLLRACFVGAAVIAFIAWSTPRAVDEVVRRIGEQATRNRNAIEGNTHRVDALERVVAKQCGELAELRRAVLSWSRLQRDELAGYSKQADLHLVGIASGQRQLAQCFLALADDRPGGVPRIGLDSEAVQAARVIAARLLEAEGN